MKFEEPFLTDPKQIKAWLKSMDVKDWSINTAGLVDVKGEVFLGEKLGLANKLPVRFGKVAGSFSCYNNQLVSLEGAPVSVGGEFFCFSNKLVSLEGAPKKVGGHFYCSYNKLVSLEGVPEAVVGNFRCNNNLLVSLAGAPKVVGLDFYCDHNQLVDFKGLDGVSIERKLVVTYPDEVEHDNVFVSLDGLPKELYSKVVGLDIQAMFELAKKRAASLLDADVEELISEVELG